MMSSFLSITLMCSWKGGLTHFCLSFLSCKATGWIWRVLGWLLALIFYDYIIFIILHFQEIIPHHMCLPICIFLNSLSSLFMFSSWNSAVSRESCSLKEGNGQSRAYSRICDFCNHALLVFTFTLNGWRAAMAMPDRKGFKGIKEMCSKITCFNLSNYFKSCENCYF